MHNTTGEEVVISMHCGFIDEQVYNQVCTSNHCIVALVISSYECSQSDTKRFAGYNSVSIVSIKLEPKLIHDRHHLSLYKPVPWLNNRMLNRNFSKFTSNVLNIELHTRAIRHGYQKYRGNVFLISRRVVRDHKIPPYNYH